MRHGDVPLFYPPDYDDIFLCHFDAVCFLSSDRYGLDDGYLWFVSLIFVLGLLIRTLV